MPNYYCYGDNLSEVVNNIERIFLYFNAIKIGWVIDWKTLFFCIINCILKIDENIKHLENNFEMMHYVLADTTSTIKRHKTIHYFK